MVTKEKWVELFEQVIGRKPTKKENVLILIPERLFLLRLQQDKVTMGQLKRSKAR
mgnify:CR=1 FL=1